MKTAKTIALNKLCTFEGHPYKVLDDEEMTALAESIREQGVLSPVLVRPLEGTDKFEIISGHRRCRAAQLAGLKQIPAIVCDMDRASAAIALVDSNLHREQLLPSEKAFAYKLKAEALKHQGQRDESASGQVVPRSDEHRSTAMIGAANGESYKTVQRYIRLTNLIPGLLDWMDEGKIAFSVGVELSYLSEDSQNEVLLFCVLADCTPSYAQANRMHKLSLNGDLMPSAIRDILAEPKANQREVLRIPMDRLKAKLPDSLSARQQEEFVLAAIDYYSGYLQKQRAYAEWER